MRCTIKDLQKVKRILLDPEIYKYTSDDYSDMNRVENSISALLENESVFFLSPNEHSVFVFIPVNGISIEVHTNVLPDGRGQEAIIAGFQVLAWIFLKTRYLKIISWIPENNRHALLYALNLGFTKEGFSKDSWLKNGTMYGSHLVGLSKEEWKCQSPPPPR